MEIEDKSFEDDIKKNSEDKSEEKTIKVSHRKKSKQDKTESNSIKQDITEIPKEESKNKSLRCLNCFSIPLLFLNHSTHTVKINCNTGHNISMDIKDYLEKGYSNNFYNQICSQCKSKIDAFTERKNYYCKECNEIFCRTCIKNHNLIFNNNENQNFVHHFINLDKFDTTCVLHNETYDYFCLECNRNICQYCYYSQHKVHKIVDLDDIVLRRKEFKKIKDNFIIEKENLNLASQLIKKLIIKIKREVNKLLEYKEAELKFKESVIKIYEKKVDNYNIIKNVKNLLFNTCQFNIDKSNSYIDQLNYFYDYINKDLSKLRQDNAQSKKSYSSINSRLTNSNISNDYSKDNSKDNSRDNIKININSNNTLSRVRDDKNFLLNKLDKDNRLNHSKNKGKSYDKLKKKKIEKKEKEKDIGPNNLILHKKRNTMQNNSELLLDNHLNKIVVNKKIKNLKKNNKIKDIKYESRNISSINSNQVINSGDEFDLKNISRASRNDKVEYDHKMKSQKSKKSDEDKVLSTLTFSSEKDNLVDNSIEVKVGKFELNKNEEKEKEKEKEKRNAYENENEKKENSRENKIKKKSKKVIKKKTKKIKKKITKDENDTSESGSNLAISNRKLKKVNDKSENNLVKKEENEKEVKKENEFQEVKMNGGEKDNDKVKEREKEVEKYTEKRKEKFIEKEESKGGEKGKEKKEDKEEEEKGDNNSKEEKEKDSIHKDNLNPYKKIHLNMNNIIIKDKNEINNNQIKSKITNESNDEDKKIEEQNKSKSKINSENKEIKEKKELKENKQNIKVIKNNSNIVDNNNIKIYSNKDLKIPKPEIKKKNDIFGAYYRHKKVYNKNHSRNSTCNFKMNHSVADFYSYFNLNESIKEDKKRIQHVFRDPSYEKRRTSLLFNSEYNLNNNASFSFGSTSHLKIFNFMGQKINKDIGNEFGNEEEDKLNNKIVKEMNNSKNKIEINNTNNKKESNNNEIKKKSKNNSSNNIPKINDKSNSNSNKKENNSTINDSNKIENNNSIEKEKNKINNLDDKDNNEKIYDNNNEELSSINHSSNNKNEISVNNNNDNNNIDNSKPIINLNEFTPVEDKEFYLTDGITLNEFKPKTLRLTVKEFENTVYSLLEINSSIFAVGFLNGEIDIYDTNDIICLFSVIEHNSRINNMCLLKEPDTFLSSSFDYTMKKIKIIEDKKTYVVEFVFDGYDNIIYKGIELFNGHILSISFGGIINIWNKLTGKAYVCGQKNVIEDEELYDIIEINNKLIAISTDENLHFFNINTNKTVFLIQSKIISDLDFKDRNNMVLLNNNLLGILLKDEIGLVDITHRQVIHRCSIYGGKPETLTLMKDKTLLISVSNYNLKDYDNETEEKNSLNKINKVIFLQYELVNNGLSFLIKKEEVSDKINSKDYCRITSVVEFNNGIIIFSTSGMEDNKMCGTISAFDY